MFAISNNQDKRLPLNIFKSFSDAVNQTVASFPQGDYPCLKQFKEIIQTYKSDNTKTYYVEIAKTLKKIYDLDPDLNTDVIKAPTESEKIELTKIKKLLVKHKEIDYLDRIKSDITQATTGIKEDSSLESFNKKLNELLNNEDLTFSIFYTEINGALNLIKKIIDDEKSLELVNSLVEILRSYESQYNFFSQPSATKNSHKSMVENVIPAIQKIIDRHKIDKTALQIAINNYDIDLEALIIALNQQLTYQKNLSIFSKKDELIKEFENLLYKINIASAKQIKKQSENSDAELISTIEINHTIYRKQQNAIKNLEQNLTQANLNLTQTQLNLTQDILNLTQQLDLATSTVSRNNTSMDISKDDKLASQNPYNIVTNKLFSWLNKDCYPLIESLISQIATTKSEISEANNLMGKKQIVMFPAVSQLSQISLLEQRLASLEELIFNYLSDNKSRISKAEERSYFLTIYHLYSKESSIMKNESYAKELLKQHPEIQKSSEKSNGPKPSVKQ